jgi:hypothetical protein
VSDAAVFVGAGFAFSGNATLGYVATVVSIFTAYVRAAGKIAGAPSEFCGPMAKQHRMLVITMTGVYATVAPRSWLLIHVGQKAVGVMSIGLAIIVIGCVVTVFRRLKRIAAALS